MNKTLDEIKKRLEELKKYRDGRIIGFPGSEPLPIAMEAFTYSMAFNPNAIMLHFKGYPLEKTSEEKESGAFAPINTMEVELLMWITSLLYGEKGKSIEQVVEDWKNEKPVWGYMTGGGDRKQYLCFMGCEKLFSEEIS